MLSSIIINYIVLVKVKVEDKIEKWEVRAAVHQTKTSRIRSGDQFQTRAGLAKSQIVHLRSRLRALVQRKHLL